MSTPLPSNLITAVCTATGIQPEKLFVRRRFREIVDARYLTMLLLVEVYSWSHRRIAEAFAIDRTTVTNAMLKAEALRFTDPEFRKRYASIANIVRDDA